jgi:2-hydroxychromene-2-carboxylate isomerase
MNIEIWSDVVCPWCYVGKRRFERAVASFGHPGEVTVTYRSFELDPDAPAERTGTHAEHLARKYGMTIAQAGQANQQMTQRAAADGLEFRFDLIRGGNTFDAHRLLHLAKDHELQPEMKERLLRATFTEGLPIADQPTLARLATEAGLPTGQVQPSSTGTPTPTPCEPTSSRPRGTASTACRSSSPTASTRSAAHSRPRCSCSSCSVLTPRPASSHRWPSRPTATPKRAATAAPARSADASRHFFLSRRREELQGDVVWVSERQARPIGRVDYTAVGDPQRVQTRFPLFKLAPIPTTERDVVKARPQLIEWLCTRWGGMVVNAEQRAAKEPHDVVERAGVLVEHRIGAEQSLIPGPAPIKIGDGHGGMRNRRKLGHHAPTSSGRYSTRRVVARGALPLRPHPGTIDPRFRDVQNDASSRVTAPESAGIRRRVGTPSWLRCVVGIG